MTLKLKEKLLNELRDCLDGYSYGDALEAIWTLFLVITADSVVINCEQDIQKFIEGFSEKLRSSFKDSLKERLSERLENRKLH